MQTVVFKLFGAVVILAGLIRLTLGPYKRKPKRKVQETPVFNQEDFDAELLSMAKGVKYVDNPSQYITMLKKLDAFANKYIPMIGQFKVIYEIQPVLNLLEKRQSRFMPKPTVTRLPIKHDQRTEDALCVGSPLDF